MSISTLILGESGTGKTTSLRNLPAVETLLIQPVKKPLPFRADGWGHRTEKNPAGNIFCTDDSQRIVKLMRGTKKKIILLDDFQYVMANEFMRRSEERGFDKFSDIARHAWDILMEASALPDDVRVYVLGHTQSDDLGRIKVKTIGKLLDEKICIEGLFSTVLRTAVVNGNYLFSTQNNGQDTVKSPLGLFDSDLIANDLAEVDQAICTFYNLEPSAITA